MHFDFTAHSLCSFESGAVQKNICQRQLTLLNPVAHSMVILQLNCKAIVKWACSAVKPLTGIRAPEAHIKIVTSSCEHSFKF